ncbi:hypothetical protein MMC07_005208 [Pseudocyphellaria aurata]|nr:hypothetical protein [Pseudocyphellaria aurata]
MCVNIAITIGTLYDPFDFIGKKVMGRCIANTATSTSVRRNKSENIRTRSIVSASAATNGSCRRVIGDSTGLPRTLTKARIANFAKSTSKVPKKSPGHDQNAKENSKSEKSKKYESGGRGKFEKDSKSQEQDQNRKSKSRKNESNFREDFSEEKKAGSSKDRSHTANMPASEAPPNHYATLRIPSNSSAEEIVKAAKKRRIEVHPDRTKRQEGLLAEDLEALDNEAKEVGFAAEILSDELLRKQYDRIYQLWYAFRR